MAQNRVLGRLGACWNLGAGGFSLYPEEAARAQRSRPRLARGARICACSAGGARSGCAQLAGPSAAFREQGLGRCAALRPPLWR